MFLIARAAAGPHLDRTQVERNRYNADLRRELLEIYGEKQRTLQQILEEEKNAL